MPVGPGFPHFAAFCRAADAGRTSEPLPSARQPNPQDPNSAKSSCLRPTCELRSWYLLDRRFYPRRSPELLKTFAGLRGRRVLVSTGSLSGSVAPWFLSKTKYSVTPTRLATPIPGHGTRCCSRPDHRPNDDDQRRDPVVMRGADDYQPRFWPTSSAAFGRSCKRHEFPKQTLVGDPRSPGKSTYCFADSRSTPKVRICRL